MLHAALHASNDADWVPSLLRLPNSDLFVEGRAFLNIQRVATRGGGQDEGVIPWVCGAEARALQAVDGASRCSHLRHILVLGKRSARLAPAEKATWTLQWCGNGTAQRRGTRNARSTITGV